MQDKGKKEYLPEKSVFQVLETNEVIQQNGLEAQMKR